MTSLTGRRPISLKLVIASAEGRIRPFGGSEAKQSRNCLGFTLIELLLVVLILTMILAASLPRFQGTLENLKIRAVANNLYSMLQYCRERAILDREYYRLRYDEKENLIRMEKKEKETYAPVAGVRGKPLRLDEKVRIDRRGARDQIEIGPEGETEKGEWILSLGKERRYILKVGEPLGRITLEEAR